MYNKNKKIIIGIVALLVVTGITVMLYFLTKPKADPKTDPCKNIICTTGNECKNGICVTSYKYIDIKDQPNNSVQIINNTTENPLYVYFESLINSKNNPTIWNKIDGQGNIQPPVNYSPTGSQKANDVGAGWWCVVTLAPTEWILLHIPDDMPHGVAWSVRPLKYRNGKPCNGATGDCGMPILIESGKDMVGDMSAVDGVNFLNKYEMTSTLGYTTIDFNTNPCSDVGLNPKGCRNPSINGIFKDNINPCLNENWPGQTCKDDSDCSRKAQGQTCKDNKCTPSGLQYNPTLGKNCWGNDPCPAGTCNVTGKTLTWCDKIHTGQCANSTSTWNGQGGSDNCSAKNKFTTYCYSHDDANSSPNFASPYKMKITYRDLVQ